MDWDDLRVFLAVARSESLSGAGKRLKIDPATVSRRIARLEAALGAGLFLRSVQGYGLTAAGERLMVHAEAAEALALKARDAVSEPSEGRGSEALISGQIRLGAPDGCANFLLPQVLERITAAHPGLEVQLVALPRVFNLSRREADMAVGVSRPETGRLTVQKIADYRLILAASRAYLEARGHPRQLAELSAHRMVGYIQDLIYDSELDYLSKLGVAGVGLSSNSVSVQLQFLRRGAGIGVVHDFAMPAAPELVAILGDEMSLARSFWLIRHADDARIARLSRFADLLTREMRAEMARLQA